MRSGLDLTTQALYDSGVYDIHYRLKVANGSGTFINLQGRYQSLDWKMPDPKEPIGSLDISFIRELTESGTADSLAPGVVNSSYNKLDDGVTYAPLLQLGHATTLELILTEVGAARPADADTRWYEVFRGVITEVDWPDWNSRTATVQCNDLGSVLKAAKSEAAYEYAQGTSFETVARQILDNNGFTTVPLHFPTATGKVLPNTYAPGVQKSVWDQLSGLGQAMGGWLVFYRYRGQNPAEVTIFPPARDKTVADAEVEPWDYRALGINETEVRNVGRLVYWDTNGAQQLVGPVVNQGSIDKYGGIRRPFWIKLEKDSPIRTETDALAMLTDAVSDVSDPDAIASILTRPLVFAEPGTDLYLFPAKDRFFDSDQKFAPFSVSINVQPDIVTSTIDVRGIPTAGTRTWRQLTGTPTPPEVIFQYASDSAGTNLGDTYDPAIHLYERQSKNGGATWSDWVRTRPLPVADVSVSRQKKLTSYITFDGSDGTGDAAKAVEYSYAIGDENESDLTNIVGGWSVWAAIPATVAIARHAFFRKVVYAKVRDAAGGESPVVTLPIQPIFHSIGRGSGRVEWIKRGTVEDEPTENVFKRGVDSADDVLATAGRTFIAPTYVDANLKVTTILRSTLDEPAENLFKKGADGVEHVQDAASLLGSTFTGNVAVSKASPNLIVDRTADAQYAFLRYRHVGTSRWNVGLSNDAAANLHFFRYDDLGGYLGSAMTIERANGNVTLGGGQLHMGSSRITNLADPVDAQDAVTRAYMHSIASGKTTYSDLWDKMIVRGGQVDRGKVEGGTFDPVVGTGSYTAMTLTSGAAYIGGQRAIIGATKRITGFASSHPDPNGLRSGDYLNVLDFTGALDGDYFVYIEGAVVEGDERYSYATANRLYLPADAEHVVAKVNWAAGNLTVVATGKQLNSATDANGAYAANPYQAKLFTYIDEADFQTRVRTYLADDEALWPVGAGVDLGRTEAWANRWGTVYASVADLSGYVTTDRGTSVGGMLHYILRNGGQRFGLGLQGDEAGSNSGSDFRLWRYDDAGNHIGTILKATRSTGVVDFVSTPTVGGTAVSLSGHKHNASEVTQGSFGQGTYTIHDGGTTAGLVLTGSGTYLGMQFQHGGVNKGYLLHRVSGTGDSGPYTDDGLTLVSDGAGGLNLSARAGGHINFHHAPLRLRNSVSGLQYEPQEGLVSNLRFFLMFDYTNNASYPFLTNRTPNGAVVIKTGTAAGGGENERFRLAGGDGVVPGSFKGVTVEMTDTGNTPPLTLGPNTTYGAYLKLGGWGTGTTYAWVRTSNGNLHMDGATGNAVYINHYSAGKIGLGYGGGLTEVYNDLKLANGHTFRGENTTWLYLRNGAGSTIYSNMALGNLHTEGYMQLVGHLRDNAGEPKLGYKLAKYNNDGTVTGAIVIHTNLSYANPMFWVRISGYVYGQSVGPFEINIGSYSNTTNFYNYGYTNTGAHRPDVRLALDANNRIVIILGYTDSSWSYPKIVVQEAGNGYTPTSLDTWSIALYSATTLPAFTRYTTLPDRTQIANAYGTTLSGNWETTGTHTFHSGITLAAGGINSDGPVKTSTTGGGAQSLYTRDVRATGSWSTANSNDPGVGSIWADNHIKADLTIAAGTELYAGNWMRLANNGGATGLYWQAGTGQGWHIYPDTVSDMRIRGGAGATVNHSLVFTCGDTVARGYIHWTTDNRIGFLTNSRGWGMHINGSKHARFYGNLGIGRDASHPLDVNGHARVTTLHVMGNATIDGDARNDYGHVLAPVVVSSTEPVNAREGTIWIS